MIHIACIQSIRPQIRIIVCRKRTYVRVSLWRSHKLMAHVLELTILMSNSHLGFICLTWSRQLYLCLLDIMAIKLQVICFLKTCYHQSAYSASRSYGAGRVDGIVASSVHRPTQHKACPEVCKILRLNRSESRVPPASGPHHTLRATYCLQFSTIKYM